MHRREKAHGFGARLQWLRRRIGAAGRDTSRRAFALQLDIDHEVYRWWEVKDSTPDSKKLELALSRVRVPDPAAMTDWLLSGKGSPPMHEALLDPADPPPTEANVADLGAIDDAVGRSFGRVVMVASALSVFARSAAAKAILSDLLRAAKRNERVEVERLVAAIKPLAESPAARALVLRLEEELQSAAGGVVEAESFSHLLQQHDEGETKRVRA